MTPREWIASIEEDALCADGFDDAIIGIGERCGQPLLVVYDIEKCIQILIDGGSSREEAEEHFDFNVLGSWVGPHTPLFLWRVPPELRKPDEKED